LPFLSHYCLFVNRLFGTTPDESHRLFNSRISITIINTTHVYNLIQFELQMRPPVSKTLARNISSEENCRCWSKFRPIELQFVFSARQLLTGSVSWSRRICGEANFWFESLSPNSITRLRTDAREFSPTRVSRSPLPRFRSLLNDLYVILLWVSWGNDFCMEEPNSKRHSPTELSRTSRNSTIFWWCTECLLLVPQWSTGTREMLDETAFGELEAVLPIFWTTLLVGVLF
jgi:hypothetical protein